MGRNNTKLINFLYNKSKLKAYIYWIKSIFGSESENVIDITKLQHFKKKNIKSTSTQNLLLVSYKLKSAKDITNFRWFSDHVISLETNINR